MKKILFIVSFLLLIGCRSTNISYDNSVKLLNSERMLWLSDNLSTNQFDVFASYMEEEVLPTIVQLEKKLRLAK